MKQLLAAALCLCISFASNVSASAPQFKIIRVPELKTLMAEAKFPVHIFDANGGKTRSKDGIILGAKLLSSSGSYDVAKELPEDLKATLVFYCYNPSCTASHTAARRALAAGYSDVSVLSDGIIGWRLNGGQVVNGKS